MKKFKLNRKIAAFTMASTIFSVGLSGCSEGKESLLEGTILEDSRVISFEDGHVDIAIQTRGCEKVDNEFHYQSIITKELFSSKTCKSTRMYHYDISSDESIIIYLTEEDIIKAMKNELTNEDIVKIVNRILDKKDNQEEIESQKVHTK